MTTPQLSDINSALSEYQNLFDILKTHFQALPVELQQKLTNWEEQSGPLIEKAKDTLAHLSSTSQLPSPPATSSTRPAQNPTSHKTLERLAPAEIQARKLAAASVFDTPISAYFLSKLQSYTTRPSIDLPLPSSTSHPELSSVAISTLDWKSLIIKKAKATNVYIFSTPGLLRAANTFLRATPLTNSTTSTMQDDDQGSPQPITPVQLSSLWTEVFITHLTAELQHDINVAKSSSTSIPARPDDSRPYDIQLLLPYITFSPATTAERAGSVDLYFDHRTFLQSQQQAKEQLSAEEPSNTDETTNISSKKRKTTPQSSSPAITPITNKAKLDTSDHADTTTSTDDCAKTSVSLDEDKLYHDLTGLFDFTPTTGESRHCVNPDTTDLQTFQFTAMGYMNSCFRAKFTTPRQGNAVDSSHAQLVLHNDIRFHSLAGLEQYSHVWLVFVFHSNAQSTYRPKITPPRLGERVGCLATRSPHRWNDIGLSLVKLDKIEYPEDYAHLPPTHPKRQFFVHTPGINSKAKNLPGCARLLLSNVDLIDGTPIIDIKPFNPGDLIPNPSALRFPDWLANAPMYTLQINFHKQVDIDLYNIFKTHYHNAFSQLKTRAKEWREAGDIVQNSNPMDVQAKKINFNYYHDGRLDKIQQYLTVFDSFTPESILNKQTTATIGDVQLSADSIQETLSNELSSPLQFYNSVPQIRTALLQTLRNDPRPIWTKFENRNRAIYGFLYDNLNVVYQMNGDTAATICFAQLREEYLRVNSFLRSEKVEHLAEKRGWINLIKTKLVNTITDPTDIWAQEMKQ